MQHDKIIVDYLYKDVLKHIEGKPTDFTVSTQNIWYKIREEVKYLSIEHKSGVVVKQFMLKDIDEKTFSSILQFFAIERTRNFSSQSFIPDLGIIKGE
ncbi:MAG: hypothetical protein JWM28_2029 [Chitinophagaceae bacterium]|nr:hypothetical protein [Chitinophagaceae bacterium]